MLSDLMVTCSSLLFTDTISATPEDFWYLEVLSFRIPLLPAPASAAVLGRPLTCYSKDYALNSSILLIVSTWLSIPSSISAWILTSLPPIKNCLECPETLSALPRASKCESLSYSLKVYSILVLCLYSETLSRKLVLSAMVFSSFLFKSREAVLNPVVWLSMSWSMLEPLPVVLAPPLPLLC